jgi:CBS domain containing-hemolysin-like protein
MMMTALLISSLIIFTLISGLSSAAETSLFSLSSLRIKAYRTDPDPRRRLIASLVLRPRELVVTLFMMQITVNILMQNSASTLFGEGSSWLLKVGVPLVLTLLFGDILPKYIAINNNTAISYAVAPTLDRIARLLSPVRNMILAVVGPVSQAMFFFLKPDEEISRDEMRHALKTSEESGVLDLAEAALVSGYLDLHTRMVKELMRPRDEILYYNLNDPLSKLTHYFVDLECSRIPVCQGTLQNLLGIVKADRFLQDHSRIQTVDDLTSILSKPFFVPESTPARVLMRQFDQRDEVLAMVVDEYGSIVGLISREDLVEVVVGDIVDRRDTQTKYTQAGEDVIIASGKLELSEIKDIFGVALHSPNNMVTLGGWLCEAMGDIPKSGTKYQTSDFLFQVLAADPNRVRRIYVRRLKQPGTSRGGS